MTEKVYFLHVGKKVFEIDTFNRDVITIGARDSSDIKIEGLPLIQAYIKITGDAFGQEKFNFWLVNMSKESSCRVLDKGVSTVLNVDTKTDATVKLSVGAIIHFGELPQQLELISKSHALCIANTGGPEPKGEPKPEENPINDACDAAADLWLKEISKNARDSLGKFNTDILKSIFRSCSKTIARRGMRLEGDKRIAFEKYLDNVGHEDFLKEQETWEGR